MNLEREIKHDFQEIKQTLEPFKLLTTGAKKTLTNESNHILSNSVGHVANMIAKNTLKNTGFLPRLIVPFLVKNVASNLVEHNKTGIVNWFSSIAAKITGKKSTKQESLSS
jgi:hypothetical protein